MQLEQGLLWGHWFVSCRMSDSPVRKVTYGLEKLGINELEHNGRRQKVEKSITQAKWLERRRVLPATF